MKLISLSMRNFMPFRGEQKVVFPTKPGQNVMVVLGNNMRGKTSLLNALRWGFYGIAKGRHLRDIPLHLLHNTDAGLDGDWEMEIAIQFEAEGFLYDLRRRAIKKKLVTIPGKPDDFEVTLQLQRDGMAMTGEQIEPEINRFIPKQVSRFFLFDGELLQEYESLLIEGSDQGKHIKEAIEQVLGVPALINGRTESGTLLKKARKQLSSELSHLKVAEKDLEKQREYQVKSDAYENDLQKLRDTLKKTKDDRALLDDQIEECESVYDAKQKLDEFERQRDRIIKEIERLNIDKLELVSNAWRDLLRPKILARREKLAAEQRRLMNQIQHRTSIENEAHQLRKILELSICPTCGQTVSQTRHDEVNSRLGALEIELQAKGGEQDSFSSISAEIDKLNKITTQEVGERIRDKDNQINRFEVELTKLENDIEKLRDEIKGHDTAEITRKRFIRDSLIKEQAKIETEVSTTQKQLETIKQELDIIARKLSNLPQARTARSSVLVDTYEGIEKAFSESIDSLRKNLREQVEERATEAFRMMTTQKAYSGLKINKNYGLSIIDEADRVIQVRSAGAEQVVALSLIDGLSRTGRSNGGPVVMDTPFGRLDLQHRDNILRYLPTTTSQLILLVHDGEISPKTDLAPIADRIGMTYIINESGPRHSVIERTAL